MKLSFPHLIRKLCPACLDPFMILGVMIPCAVYMATLAPSVTFFDSGEFVTATASLGSAHSPGYPLFLMYAKAFTWLPLGSIAFRVNMATAFSASLACLGAYMLTVMLLRSERLVDNERFSAFSVKGAGLAAAVLFAFSPRLWLQSNHDKPYPLLACISVIILLLLLRWRNAYRAGEDRPAYIYAGAFLAGLSMALHHTVVLLVPAWAVLILCTDWRLLYRFKELFMAVLSATLGFSVHLYLPLRATQNPLLNWGDTKSLPQFMWHFLRKGYQDEPHARSLALLWQQIKAFSIAHEFTWLGVLLAVLGLVFVFQRQRSVAYAYLVAVAMFLLVIVGYFNTVPDMIFLTEEFFTPLYLMTASLIGIGLYCLLAFAVQRARLPEQYGLSVYLVVVLLYFSLPLMQCARNYYENDQHNNYIAYEYASNTFRSLPQNAILFTWGDSGAFPLWYLQGVERMREDVDLPHTPHLVFNWYLESMPRLFKTSILRRGDIQPAGAEVCLRNAISENLGRRPVYVDFSTRYSVTFSEYLPVQKGIVYRVRRSSEPAGVPDISVWDNFSSRGVMDKISFLDLDTGKALMIYANSYLELGEHLMSVGHVGSGAAMLEKAERISAEMKPYVEQVRARY